MRIEMRGKNRRRLFSESIVKSGTLIGARVEAKDNGIRTCLKRCN